MRRRNLLRALGAGALTIPLGQAFRPAPARAAGGHAKYLFLLHTNGTAPWLWTPAGSTATNLVFSPMTQPLEALRSDLIIVEKLSSNGTADNHGAPGSLTGEGYSSNSRTSVDQFISDQLVAAGRSGPIPNVLLGSVASEQQSDFYRDGQVLSPIFDPSTAFQAVFGTTPGGGGAEEDPAVVARRREGAMALVRDELEALGAELGGSEKQKVELHLDSLRQLEELLSGTGGGGASCPEPMEPGDPGQPLLNSQAHVDLGINAMGCGLTNVVSVQYGHHQSTQFDLPGVGTADWHNAVLHNLGNAEQTLVNLERWLAEQFVAAANKLRSLPDPSGIGTLYDHTLMVWTRDMGDAVNHNGDDMRFVFAGGAGGYFNHQPGGVYLDGGGDAHQRALLTIAEGMGITNLDGFGDPNGARAPLAGVGSL